MSKTPHDTLDPHETLSLDEAHHAHVHVIPFRTMTAVFAILVVLTVITVLTAHYIHLPGSGNIIVAMFIAIVKGLLVGGFFMHLVYDRVMNSIVVGATLFAVVLFIGLTAIDIHSRGMIEAQERGEILKGGSLGEYAGELHFPLTGRTMEKPDLSITELAVKNGEAEHKSKAEDGKETPAKPGEPAPAPHGGK